MAKSGIEAGSAFVRLGLDPTEFQRGLQSARSRLSSISRSITGFGKALTGFGLAAAAPFALAVREAGAMQTTMAKFDTVFGDNSSAVKAWGDDFAKSVGLSQRSVASFLAETQDLLKPMGFATDAATDMSKEIVKLSADLAAFNGFADDDVINDLKAALTGSGEVMKKYGVIVSAAAVNQELLNMQLDPKTATEAEKAQARLNIIMRGTVDAQGAAADAAGTFEGRVKALKAQLQNTALTVGSALLPYVEQLAGQASIVATNVAEWIENNKELVPILAAVAAGVVALGTAAIALGPALAGASAAISLFSTGIALANPVSAAIAALIALGAVALAVGTDFEDLADQVDDAVGDIKRSFEAGGLEAAWEVIWITLQETVFRALASMQRGFAELTDSILSGPLKAAALLNPALAVAAKGSTFVQRGAGNVFEGQADQLASAREELVQAQQKQAELNAQLANRNGGGAGDKAVQEQKTTNAHMRELIQETKRTREEIKSGLTFD